MKSLSNIIVCFLLSTSFLLAQFADPAVTGANYVPNSIEVGEQSELTFSFANAGFTPIPMGSVEVTVSMADLYYHSDGVSAPTGTAAGFFSWTYLSVDQWRGTNTVDIPALTGGEIMFEVTALASHDFPQTTNINAQIVSDFGLFANNIANDNLQPQLMVNPAVACTDPEPVLEGDFFVCRDETTTYTVPNAGVDNDLVFTLSGGGTIVSETQNSVTIEFGDIPGAYQLNVSETTPEGCEGFAIASVVIEDDIVLVCNDNLNISLSNDCALDITPDVILESPEYEDDSYTIIVKDENGNIISGTIGADYIGQTLEVSVIHDCSGNQCWGDITIEDKIAPVIECANDTLSCDEYQNFVPFASLIEDNCDNAILESDVSIQELTCDPDFSRILTVTFTAVDLSGNEAEPCISTIWVEKDYIADINLPINYDGLTGNNATLSCSGSYPTNSDGYPDPSYTGYPGGLNNCNSIEWTYSDIFIPICDVNCAVNNSSYKVIRTWVIVDWCTGEILEHQQIIKVEDKEAPVIGEQDDIVASVNPFDCSAQITLPTLSATDNCSAEMGITLTYATNVGTIVGNVLMIDAPAKTMGQGVEITVTASDCCGNESETSFFVNIVDETPPVVVADAHEVISLLPGGSATLYATSLDDGSYDNCGPIGFSAKRMDNGSGLPSIDLFPPNGNDNGQFNEVVHFFCADIPNNPIMVQFQVCDDADMNGVIGSVGDNCNVAMIEVEVQDKYAPVILCPENITISCTEFEGIDITDHAALDALFGSTTAAGTCDVDLVQTVTGTDELECGEGVIIRNFTATNNAGTNTCSQVITVIPFVDNLLTCDRISFDDLNNNIYNWCDVNDNTNNNNDDLPALEIVGCEGITIAEVNVDIAGLCTTAGIQVTIDTFDYAGSSACKTYIVHYEVIDQCVFDENYVNPSSGQIDPYHTDNGYFEFYLEYNVVDNDAPVLTCEAETVDSDICAGYTGSFSIVAEDACTPDNELQYEFRLDINGDGSVDLPLNGNWFNGNSVTGSVMGLTAIPQGTHIILWRVGDGCGNFQTCSQSVTILEETKAPSPYCYSDLSTAVMPSTGTIDIWAKDFDAGSEDNCGAPVLLTMIPVLDVIDLTDEQAYDQSFNHPNVTIQTSGDYGFAFDCDYIPNGVSAVIEVRIYVTDESGNYDYCTAALRIDDNFDVCEDEPGMLVIDGSIYTDKGEAVELVDVELKTELPEFPINQVTIEDGLYSFDGLFSNMKYDLTPTRNDYHLNGISTLDIILIQKHILGLEILDSPYLLIAADVNNDCKITGTDLVQLRRLLLGKYINDELPDNSSWRFVESDFEFTLTDQPCEYNEYTELFNMTESSTADFVGVKIGDINESVEANLMSTAETRTQNELIFFVDNISLERGKKYEVPVYAADFIEAHGFQFMLAFENTKLVGIESGKLDLTAANYHAIRNNQAAISFNSDVPLTKTQDEVLFTLVVRAKENTTLRQSLNILSDKLIAEVYTGEQLEVSTPVLEFRTEENQTNALEFELYQNEPNPFSEFTNIAFMMPKSTTATLSIYDLTGKVVYQYQDVFPQGYNIVEIRESEISGRGMLYYTLESNDFTATKKMMLID